MAADPAAAPPKTMLRELLKRPGARPRIGRAVGSLLAVGLASLAVLGVLIIWHLIRRGRLIQARQPPPRDVKPPLDFGPKPLAELDDEI